MLRRKVENSLGCCILTDGKDCESQRPHCYVFDLDGTLFTIPVDWVKARDEVGKIARALLGNTPLFPKVVHPSVHERNPLRDA